MKNKDRFVHNLRLDFHMTQRTLAPVRFSDGLTGLRCVCRLNIPGMRIVDRSLCCLHKEIFETPPKKVENGASERKSSSSDTWPKDNHPSLCIRPRRENGSLPRDVCSSGSGPPQAEAVLTFKSLM